MSETGKKTWDLPTRFLHWLIAGSLITSLTLALLAEGLEDILGKKWETLFLVAHLYVGLFAIGLVLTRIIWGFFGNKSINWRGLPAGIAAYPGCLKAEIAVRKGEKNVTGRKEGGHNALAIPVYVAALLFFTIQAITGLLLWSHLDKQAEKYLGYQTPSIISSAWAHGDEHEEGPGMARMGGKRKSFANSKEDDDDKEEWAEEIHEFGVAWLLGFLALHIGGLVMHYRTEDKDVFRKMLISPHE